MSLFDLGQNLSSNISATQSTIGAASNLIKASSNLSGALRAAANASDIGSAIRSLNIPAGAEAVGDLMSAVSSFSSPGNPNDWRVRLSLANWTSFQTSPVLAPLAQAGGLIFPYTPSITISSGASYGAVAPTHSNYAFQAYKHSDPGSISITAPMYVEDPTQALYWIAMVHYLRSLTKMFTGNDAKAGNPPAIVYLNGYGNYVFKNIPVVVTKMSVTLDAQSDYIGCNVSGSMASEVANIADQLGGLADSIGGAFSGLSGITSTVSGVLGGVGQIAGALGAFGIGGTVGGGVAHVPTKSQFEITLQPVYSRTTVRNFSLDRFVSGGYMSSAPGFL